MTGEPLKMAEVIAQLDGPIFVQRTALYDSKQRNRTKKAILKGLKLQVENKGFSFIEVLSECPTHLKMQPEEAEQWVKENLEAVFPLGVKKEVESEAWFSLDKPIFDSDKVLESITATAEKAPAFAKEFPMHIKEDDIALKLAGAGGDGAQTIAMLLTKAAINEGYDATHIPSYGPESRGGTSYADVHVANEEVLSPASPEPDILIAFNAPSLNKFASKVRPGGTIIYDSSVISSEPEVQRDVRIVGIPFTEIAVDIGNKMVKNIVALGALYKLTNILPQESFLHAIRSALKEKCSMIEINETAFERGANAAVSSN